MKQKTLKAGACASLTFRCALRNAGDNPSALVHTQMARHAASPSSCGTSSGLAPLRTELT